MLLNLNVTKYTLKPWSTYLSTHFPYASTIKLAR